MNAVPDPYHERLLRRARQGNEGAINELLGSYQNYLRVLAYSGLSPRLQARVTVSDVIQETMLHAFGALKQFHGDTREEFVAWIRTILASRIADAHEKHLRAARRDVRREVSIETISQNLSHSNLGLEAIARSYLERSPGTAMVVQEQALKVADSIGSLPQIYQQVIIARHFEGMSFEQIAVTVEKSSGAVRMIWLRAIQRLKQHLGDGSCED
ncbi:sigma-70 family RNA polymerase sigma factor [Stieleria sp. JC731]|uniref:sigma-70 family RNA polymerase sigma factor n=1 Tax=Pirellulaceae TaxID=2691357 RepID=UPI001E6326D3|nr:sigma-70 family RNA polymerase sigma factor [Stieleria sp. JC731]MCC9599400.1 sigma-70 family RNA polymerase sigma factor [Stieleria sp. JC731]